MNKNNITGSKDELVNEIITKIKQLNLPQMLVLLKELKTVFNIDMEDIKSLMGQVKGGDNILQQMQSMNSSEAVEKKTFSVLLIKKVDDKRKFFNLLAIFATKLSTTVITLLKNLKASSMPFVLMKELNESEVEKIKLEIKEKVSDVYEKIDEFLSFKAV